MPRSILHTFYYIIIQGVLGYLDNPDSPKINSHFNDFYWTLDMILLRMFQDTEYSLNLNSSYVVWGDKSSSF